MRLDKRMSAILNQIPPNKNLADIGADHGYISISYALKNQNNIVVSSDISKKSIQKAAETSKQLGLKNYFVRVGNGLLPIDDLEIDVVLISGMGGAEIIDILKKGKRYPMYILSPQKNADKVRSFLQESNLKPTKDFKVLSCGKFYDIIVAEQGEYHPTQFELNFGSGIGEDFLLYKEQTKTHLQSLLNVVKNDKEKKEILNKLSLIENKF